MNEYDEWLGIERGFTPTADVSVSFLLVKCSGGRNADVGAPRKITLDVFTDTWMLYNKRRFSFHGSVLPTAAIALNGWRLHATPNECSERNDLGLSADFCLFETASRLLTTGGASCSRVLAAVATVVLSDEFSKRSITSNDFFQHWVWYRDF